MRVLIVEDNLDLAESISDYLSIHGCDCDFAYNGVAGLEFALKNEYDIFIFDIAMPKMDGLELCKILREKHNNQIPILFLTARDTLDDKVAGFDAGADDYLVKPFELKELLIRIKALYKRVINKESILNIDDLSINLNTQEVKRDNQSIFLSPNNYKILVLLMQRSPNLVTREELEHFIWMDETPSSDSLRSHIYKLRKQIDKPFKKELIQTIKGRGFRIVS
ncbi:response regulator transcription factor [Poseidonibacter lekithochrous]|uniref:response regulator transcription factor n=1 Tax=Poseidonibacter lekithochrous TaxID=1904463 RepID=UPI0008FCB24B|nr:response regulator transcription factor [Poseidonibacter lekithochrous]QKJ23652.1 two-component system response regulator [Poseidonibacter lekithochrous]